MIIFGTKYEFSLLPHQITFFLTFRQAKIIFSYHILVKILIHILFCNKKSLNNIPYRKLSLITELQTTFQNKKMPCFNKMFF